MFCVDFTGDYRVRLQHLKPVLPGPTEEQADELEEALFAAETGAYGGGAGERSSRSSSMRSGKPLQNRLPSFWKTMRPI